MGSTFPFISMSLYFIFVYGLLLLLLLLSHFSHVRLCATPQMAAHQAPLSLGFSRQERWSGLPFPSSVVCYQIHAIQNYYALLWRRKWHPTPVLLPGEFHRWRSLVGYSSWSRRESDRTEQLHFLSFCSSFWRRKWQPTPVFLPGESHGRRGLVGDSLWGCKESVMTKQLTHMPS